jgi:lipopolysaccharide export LptBFGC system permease protein LptF
VVLSLTGGLIFYFVKDFLHVMGTSGRLHPIVAGFSPGVIMVCLGVILLMRADEN